MEWSNCTLDHNCILFVLLLLHVSSLLRIIIILFYTRYNITLHQIPCHLKSQGLFKFGSSIASVPRQAASPGTWRLVHTSRCWGSQKGGRCVSVGNETFSDFEKNLRKCGIWVTFRIWFEADFKKKCFEKQDYQDLNKLMWQSQSKERFRYGLYPKKLVGFLGLESHDFCREKPMIFIWGLWPCREKPWKTS